MHNKKIWMQGIISLAIISCTLPFSQASGATEKAVITLDGKTVSLDASPMVQNGQMLLPVRAVLEQLNMKIKWDNSSKTVTAAKDDLTIQFMSNQKKATVNGKPVSLSEAPYLSPEEKTLYINLNLISETTGASVHWNNSDKAGAVTDNHSEHPSGSEAKVLTESNGILLSSHAEKLGIYQGITVQKGILRKSFPWQSVTNPTYAPEVLLADLNGNGEQEIIIILVTGTGTGVHVQDIHVLKANDLTELTVQDPLAYIKKHVNSSIKMDKDRVQVSAFGQGQSFTKSYLLSDVGQWNEDIFFGNIIKYEVIGNTLKVMIPGAVSPSEYAVTVVLEYDADLLVKSIQLLEEE